VGKSTLLDLVTLCRRREEQDDYKYYYHFEDCVTHEIYARVRVPVFSSIFGPGALHLHEDLETRLGYICIRTDENDTESLCVFKGRYRNSEKLLGFIAHLAHRPLRFRKWDVLDADRAKKGVVEKIAFPRRIVIQDENGQIVAHTRSVFPLSFGRICLYRSLFCKDDREALYLAALISTMIFYE
jgi:hypothetical protein